MRLLLQSFARIKSACNLSTAVLTTSCALVPNVLVKPDQLIRIGCNRSAEVRSLFKGRINGADFGPQGIRDIGVGATTSSNLHWNTHSFRGLVVDKIPHGDAFYSIFNIKDISSADSNSISRPENMSACTLLLLLNTWANIWREREL